MKKVCNLFSGAPTDNGDGKIYKVNKNAALLYSKTLIGTNIKKDVQHVVDCQRNTWFFINRGLTAGNRVFVRGCSQSGKTTTAAMIAGLLDMDVCHFAWETFIMSSKNNTTTNVSSRCYGEYLFQPMVFVFDDVDNLSDAFGSNEARVDAYCDLRLCIETIPDHIPVICTGSSMPKELRSLFDLQIDTEEKMPIEVCERLVDMHVKGFKENIEEDQATAIAISAVGMTIGDASRQVKDGIRRILMSQLRH